MTDFTLPLREDLIGESPYGAPHDHVPARLNVNENPFAPSQHLINDLAASISEAAESLNRYPDRDAVALRQALATYISNESFMSLDIDRIWPGNGSNEVMAHIFSAFGGPGRAVLTFPPTYSMYPEYARNSFTEMINVPRNHDFEIETDSACDALRVNRPTLAVIAAPNNPTGTSISMASLSAIVECAQSVGALVVVDEAYAEFRSDPQNTAVQLLNEYPNLIVTRTLSKAFGFAGGRVGYCLTSSPAIVQALMLVRLPYHLSALTQVAAITALQYDSDMREQIDLLRSERRRVADSLASLDLVVAPSDANFLFFGTFHNRHSVWSSLLDRGVLIRETGPDHWLRVSIGTPSENNLFIESMSEIMSEQR